MLRGMTARQLAENLPYKVRADTVYRNLEILCDEGLVSRGIKDGNANSYYINDEGLKILEQLKEAK